MDHAQSHERAASARSRGEPLVGVYLRLPPHHARALRRAAQQHGLGLSALARRCLLLGLLLIQEERTFLQEPPVDGGLRRRPRRALPVLERWLWQRLTQAQPPPTPRRLAVELVTLFGLPQRLLPRLIALARRIQARHRMRRARSAPRDLDSVPTASMPSDAPRSVSSPHWS
jgi:hypothetical protein